MSFTNTSEASSLMSPLCGFSPLWDPELFWDPSGPTITPCLEQVGLPLFHLLFLVAVLPLEIFTWRLTHVKSGQSGRLSFLLLLKIFTALLIMVIGALQLGLETDQSSIPYTGKIFGFMFASVSVTLYTTVLLISTLWNGKFSSGPLWFYTLVLTTCASLPIISSENSWQHVVTGRFVSCLGLFLLHWFSDPGKKGGNISGSRSEVEDCPEKESSFPQKLLHTWTLPLLWRGFRTPLTMGHLWQLPKELKSSSILSNFDPKWEKVKTEYNCRQAKKEEPGPGVSLLPALTRTFASQLLLVAALEVLTVFFWQVSPVVMMRMIRLAANGCLFF